MRSFQNLAKSWFWDIVVVHTPFFIIGRAIPSNLPNLFSTYIFNFTSYIFFFVVKLFHVCGLAEINMQTFQIGEPISLKQCELWQKVLSSSVHSFWLKKENYKWKPRGIVKLRTFTKRERWCFIQGLYFNEKERRCTKSMKHDILAFIFGCL